MKKDSWIKLVNSTATYYIQIISIDSFVIYGNYCFKQLSNNKLTPLYSYGAFEWKDIKSIKVLKKIPKYGY